MGPATSCKSCGTVLTAPAGPCPSCLLREALDEPRGKAFGDYELLEVLGRGGMGVIYRARQRGADRVVALKMILAGDLATSEEIHRFRAEAQAASQLDHPHIVPIYDVGEVEGRAYYTMKVMEGGSLADHLEQYRGDQRGAAELIARVARAVRHGHELGILHRDLKPSNILLDGAGRPHVADFGVAKQVGIDSAATHSGSIVGTPGYMAPEQIAGNGRRITTAADVYSLGAILYELLTGRPPFEGENAAEVLRKVCEAEPARPRALDPSIDRDLETICLECLEKDPSRRYDDAEALAEDLGRYLREEPIAARPLGALGRTARWIKRHRFASVIAFGALAILISIAGAAVTVVQRQQEDLGRDAMQRNVYAAKGVAGTFLFQLRELAEVVERAASHPDVVALATQPHSENQNIAAVEAALTEAGVGTTFVSATVFDVHGTPLMRWPRPGPKYFQDTFEWRDYFGGAKALADLPPPRTSPLAYTSRAFQSEPTEEWRFSFSAPIFDARGSWVGVLMASARTASALGQLRIEGATLVGKKDHTRETRGGALPKEHVILLHDAPFEEGGAVALESPALDQLEAAMAARPLAGRDQFRLLDNPPTASIENYQDPVPGFGGSWLASIAPVGDTGYFVIVQTRPPENLLPRRLAAWAGGVFTVGVLAIGALLALLRRPERREAS